MGALNGRMSPLGFRVRGQISNWDEVLKELTRRRFQDLDPATDREEATGWVQLTDPFETEFTLPRIFFGEHLVGVSVRVDTLSVSPGQLKLHLNRTIKLKMAENEGQKLTRGEIDQLRDDLRSQWIRRMVPTIKVYEVLVHTATGRLWYFGRSKGALGTFLDLWKDTFKLPLVPDSPYTEAVNRIGEERAEDLLNLEETRFAPDMEGGM